MVFPLKCSSMSWYLRIKGFPPLLIVETASGLPKISMTSSCVMPNFKGERFGQASVILMGYALIQGLALCRFAEPLQNGGPAPVPRKFQGHLQSDARCPHQCPPAGGIPRRSRLWQRPCRAGRRCTGLSSHPALSARPAERSQTEHQIPSPS